MFVTPEWENHSLNSEYTFTKGHNESNKFTKKKAETKAAGIKQARKRKENSDKVTKLESDSSEPQKKKKKREKLHTSDNNNDTSYEKPDEIFLANKREELLEVIKKDDVEDMLFSEDVNENEKHRNEHSPAEATLHKSNHKRKKTGMKKSKEDLKETMKGKNKSISSSIQLNNKKPGKVGQTRHQISEKGSPLKPEKTNATKLNDNNAALKSKSITPNKQKLKKPAKVDQTGNVISEKGSPLKPEKTNATKLNDNNAALKSKSITPNKQKLKKPGKVDQTRNIISEKGSPLKPEKTNAIKLNDKNAALKSKSITTKSKQKLKKKFASILEKANSNRTSLKTNGAALRERMMDRLKGAQFRYLNEKLYLSEGKDAKELFKSNPESFQIYHNGFRQQVKKWPMNPLDIIIKQISKMPKETKVADLGCGDGMLGKTVPQNVRSFDLVSSEAGVEECDMAHTPLLTAEMDIVVYCLALMGTNLKEYLIEANRILKVGGTMKIAEVESRFDDINSFIKSVESYGFKLSTLDDSRKIFYFLDFKKQRDLGSKRSKLPPISLKPCYYKKR